VSGSPVSDDGVAACWVEISHDGAYAFVVNTGSATISTYSIAASGALTFVRSTSAGQLGSGAEDARLSPDGSTLWVVAAGSDAVFGFSVDGAALTPLSTTPGPAGAAPTGVVLT
jgi:6-phosphogluconolactonase (cycloisomerase 2 family)